jgi:hypothetical protein
MVMSIKERRKKKTEYMSKWRKQRPELEARNKILSLFRFLAKLPGENVRQIIKDTVAEIKKIIGG